MNPNFLPSGHLLHQRYSIQQSLGQGGFGITYLAYDSKLDQEVCIKELFVSGNSTRGTNLTVHSQTTGGFSFSDFVQRFLQEARQLARFQHPNIVRALDIFQENDTAYTVMEYVRGENLKQLIKRQGVLTGQKVLQLTDQLLDAVEEVHKKGMLHRDIKPENVLVTEEGRLVLIDFGSAREFSDGKTTTQTAMLTPGYAPIEQYSDRAQRGPYTDIYALGATIYFMLSGQKPIAATDRSIEELAAPHHLNSEISSQVSTAVMLAMEIKPERRFQHIAEMREALKSLQGDSEIEKGEEAVPTENPDPVEKEKREGKQKSLDNTFILAAVVIFLVVIIFLSRNKSTEALQTENTAITEVNTIENQPDFPAEERTEPEQVNQGTLDQQAEQVRQRKAKEYGTLSDIQGNQYKTVMIGNQVWMAENLDVDRFRNGDLIPEAKTAEEWKRAGEGNQPAWSYYDNNPANGVIYGKLYNWHAVTDPRGLAPKDWHIPSDREWTALTDYLGGRGGAGVKMKSTMGWEENTNATNESGFSGLPGGNWEANGKFRHIGLEGYWWSSTEDGADSVWDRLLVSYYGTVYRGSPSKESGFSVRCLRD